MNIDGSTKIVGVFGWPVEHTASPRMHNVAFEALDLNWVYLPFEVKPDMLEPAVKAIIPLNIRGVNLTIPHKKDVIPFLDELSSEAQFIGTVNTIVKKGNKLIGYNTDGQGFMRALEENKISVLGKKVLILGAGGASFGISRELILKGADKLFVANRTLKRTEDLKKMLGEIEVLPLEKDSLKSVLKGADIVINTTSVGMKKDDRLLISENWLGPSIEAVVDIIYSPPETKLLRMARKKNIKTINGLDMLLHQGALSFELWTGKKAPIEVMRKALYKKFKTRK
ncbi:MAG: shikimate dehydrogenase [Candidatus Ratteibacteria bacterium]|nr:shikimate dehydrogenase [Candidatus Ratteibacteria bacterium]